MREPVPSRVMEELCLELITNPVNINKLTIPYNSSNNIRVCLLSHIFLVKRETWLLLTPPLLIFLLFPSFFCVFVGYTYHVFYVVGITCVHSMNSFNKTHTQIFNTIDLQCWMFSN